MILHIPTVLLERVVAAVDTLCTLDYVCLCYHVDFDSNVVEKKRKKKRAYDHGNV